MHYFIKSMADSQHGPFAYTLKDFHASSNVLASHLGEPRVWRNSEEPPKNPPPDDCGSAAEFAAVPSASGASQKEVVESAGNVLFRTRRADLLAPMREAVLHFAESGALAHNRYCNVFGSCTRGDRFRHAEMPRLSLHSDVFLPCPSYARVLAPYAGMFRGTAGHSTLPGALGKQGDENILCRLAEHVREVVMTQVMPALHMRVLGCMVHEVFTNVQKTGAWTNAHMHDDDFYGGEHSKA